VKEVGIPPTQQSRVLCYDKAVAALYSHSPVQKILRIGEVISSENNQIIRLF